MPLSPSLTLPEFYRQHVRPSYVGRLVSLGGERSYEAAVSLWSKQTDNVSLDRIDDRQCRLFVDGLAAHSSRKGGGLSDKTVYIYSSNVQRVLALAGPPTEKMPWAASLLAIVPRLPNLSPVDRPTSDFWQGVRQQCEQVRAANHFERRALSPSMTLCQFFESFVLPVWFAGRNEGPATTLEYRRSLALWAEFTGDPPLNAVDDWMASEYLAGLYALPGRDGDKLSPFTVHKHCRNVQACLNLAGPRINVGPRSCAARKGQGLLSEVPWLERPVLDDEAPEDVFTLAEVGAILAACHTATRPAWPMLSSEQFWRSLVIVAYNTGERRGALLTVRLDSVSTDGLSIKFDKMIRKGRQRSHRVPLNAAAREAIDAMRTPAAAPSRRIFPWPNWPNSSRWFHTHWTRLLVAAGLPEERRFGLHGLRKAACTAAAEINPLAAQLLLGHTDFKTTQRHYLHPRLLAETLDKLPQPLQIVAKGA